MTQRSPSKAGVWVCELWSELCKNARGQIKIKYSQRARKSVPTFLGNGFIEAVRNYFASSGNREAFRFPGCTDCVRRAVGYPIRGDLPDWHSRTKQFG